MDGATNALLTTAELARRPPLTFGAVTIDPPTRTLRGPGGSALVEPRVMQVLVVLADAAGQVVTRDILFQRCWGSPLVGDDSLNRAIGAARRLVAAVAGDAITVETIPRVGYRLTGSDVAKVGTVGWSRRQLVLAGGVGTIGAAAALAAWRWSLRPDPRAAALTDRARRMLTEVEPSAPGEPVEVLRRATSIAPWDAAALGLYAVALRDSAEKAAPNATSAAVGSCEEAARRALAIDPKQSDALAALAVLRPYFGDWARAEDRLRQVLAVDPDNFTALAHLTTLLQSVGRTKASWDINERVFAVAPLSPIPSYRRGLKYWILGRVAEADLAIDRALSLWPRHAGVWNARVYIFAFTGRAEAALAMLNEPATIPVEFPLPAQRLWEDSLTALATGRPADIAKARAANLAAAPKSPGFAVQSTMVLSALGLLDDAFAVAEGSLLRRGALIGAIASGGGELPVNDQYWRRTMNLFTPATAAMRTDARFAALCRGIKLTDYWKLAGRAPDAFLKVRF